MINITLRPAARLNLLALCSVVMLPGCATIIHGKNQSVEIMSNPPGADVLVDGQPRGTTPLKTEMRRGQPHYVQIQKPGYLTETTVTTTKLNATPILNVILGGVPGMAVDLGTGAATDVVPEKVGVSLAPEITPPSPVQPASFAPQSGEGRVRLN